MTIAKSLGSEINESLDPISSREERRATGRMVAVIVALLMIFSGFYHAWMKKIPVLAGVMVPALIMLLYAAWVLFLAKREKQRRLNAENHLRASATALSEIIVITPEPSITSSRRNHAIDHTHQHNNNANHNHHHHHGHHLHNNTAYLAKGAGGSKPKKHRKDCQFHPRHQKHRASTASNDLQMKHLTRPLLPPLPPVPVLDFDRHYNLEGNARRSNAHTLFRSLSAR